MSRFEEYGNIFGETRRERALYIFRKGRIVHLGNNRYIVPSQTEQGQTYKVYYPFKCTCPDFASRRSVCKHILAAGMMIQNYKMRNPISSKHSSRSSSSSWRSRVIM